MIQFRRGKTSTWQSQTTPLADGQPGYDKDRNKIKIGNGKDSWENLPDVSGLRMDEILVSEEDAQKQSKGLMSLLDLIKKVFKRSGKPVFTYGTAAPSKDTLGQVYLQHYEAEPELDYVVDKGISNGWYFQKWHSGFAQCSTTFEIEKPLTNVFEKASLFYCTAISGKQYPFTFTKVPTELISLTSNGNIVWLAGKTANSTTTTGTYLLIGPDSKPNARYKINIELRGYWR